MLWSSQFLQRLTVNAGWIQHRTPARGNHHSDHSVTLLCECLGRILVSASRLQSSDISIYHITGKTSLCKKKAFANATKDRGFLFSIVGKWAASMLSRLIATHVSASFQCESIRFCVSLCFCYFLFHLIFFKSAWCITASFFPHLSYMLAITNIS